MRRGPVLRRPGLRGLMPLLIKLPGATRTAVWRRRLADFGRKASNVVPPTWMGSLVGGLSALALWRWGYGEMDLLIFVFSLSGLALLGLGSLFTVGSALYLRRYIRRHPQILNGPLPSVETGSPTETGFVLPSLGRLPLVKIQWRFVTPDGLRSRPRWRDGVLVEEVVAERRCHVERVEREIETRDAFGLSRVAWRFGQSGPMVVLPHVGRLGSMPRVQSMSSSEGLPHPSGAPEGDRMEIRRYVPGDPVRHILWKVYARTRQLNVRAPERAVDRSQRMVAYLLTGPGDGAAAAAARMALQNELLGPDWLFAADGFPTPTDDLQQGLLAIAGSGQHRSVSGARPADGLRAFLARPEIASEGHCVVFAAAEPGPWVDDTMAAARTFSGVTSFILGTDGVTSGAPRSWWHRLLFVDSGVSPSSGVSPNGMRDAATGATTAEDLTTLMTTLNAGRNLVMVVDRKSGRSHGRMDSHSLSTAGMASLAGSSTARLGRTG